MHVLVTVLFILKNKKFPINDTATNQPVLLPKPQEKYDTNKHQPTNHLYPPFYVVWAVQLSASRYIPQMTEPAHKIIHIHILRRGCMKCFHTTYRPSACHPQLKLS